MLHAVRMQQAGPAMPPDVPLKKPPAFLERSGAFPQLLSAVASCQLAGRH
jgi:hypothetical protein